MVDYVFYNAFLLFIGGQAKTLMFVNVSPLRAHLQETLTSLRFAVKANNCSLA